MTTQTATANAVTTRAGRAGRKTPTANTRKITARPIDASAPRPAKEEARSWSSAASHLGSPTASPESRSCTYSGDRLLSVRERTANPPHSATQTAFATLTPTDRAAVKGGAEPARSAGHSSTANRP